MSIAFRANSQPRKTVKPLIQEEEENESDSRHQITSFAGSEMAVQAPKVEGNLCIDPIPNTFRDGKRYIPSYIPEKTSDADLKSTGIENFEIGEVDTSKMDGTQIKYGLTKREQGTIHAMSQQERDAVALQEDLRNLPQESSLEDYERMPVEAFGEALMRGMGWYKGRGIGRNAKGEVEAKELVRRADKLGLGADPAISKNVQKKFIKPGEKRNQDELVYVGSDGAVKSSRPVNANLTRKAEIGVAAGKKMYLRSGKHGGFECEVKNVDNILEKASVRLLPSLETVTVPYKDLVDLSQKRQHADQKEKVNVKKVKLSRIEESIPWLYTNIRIKVVDKKAFGGSLYLKKGTVIDVKAPKVCDVYIDDFAKIFQDLDQDQLETYVPRQSGTIVLVVAGKFKGREGQLLHRSKQSDYVAVRVNDEDDVQKLHLDDIAEYRSSITA